MERTAIHDRSPRRPRVAVVAATAILPLCAAAIAQTTVFAADADLIVRIPFNRAFTTGVFYLGVVHAAPDVDGDGVPDLILTSEFTLAQTGATQPGRVALVSGATGELIWSASGVVFSERFGRSITIVRDLNGDGTSDVAVGEFGTGRVVLLSGATGERIGAIDPPAPETSSFSFAIAALRDATGDATRLAVGSPRLGRGYIYSLADEPPPPRLLLPGDDPFPFYGIWTTNIGDVNGDGVDDVALTEPDILRAVFVHSGADGAPLHAVWERGVTYGQSVAMLGDIDGDGAPEYLIASPRGVRAYSGASGAARFGVYYTEADLQRAVIGVGDVTGDGVPDFAVGNPDHPPDDGFSSDPDEIGFGRVLLYCGRTRQLIREYSGAAPQDRLGHSLALVPNADGAGRSSIMARAFRSGDDPDATGAYGYVFLMPAPCLGDANFDRVINAADLGAVLAQYGQSGPLSGDLNFDGAVDFSDFMIVLSRYGAYCE